MWSVIALAVSVLAPAGNAATIGVSPQLVDAAAEVWSVVATDHNPIWPGWNARATPLLLYLPGQQDLLINHPHPPEGFTPYHGPLSFPGGEIVVKNGSTLIMADGQNTSIDVGGVKTLVVADPLSNLRSHIGNLIEDPRPAAEKARSIRFEELVADPYEQLRLIVHEAFHVYQGRAMPSRETNEMLLLNYPTLSASNNTLFALEAAELQRAIEAHDAAASRDAALRWLAIREARRKELPARAVQYEDGTEFKEGLAKYTEYRLFEVLEGRTPRPDIARAQGFHGFGDLSEQRKELLGAMRKNMRGEVIVNNDPYGTAPIRFRLYYSGMGLGLLLDRISADWKQQLSSSSVSMTDIARAALHPTDAELASALAAVRSDRDYSETLAEKTKLADAGRKEFASRLAAIESGAGTAIVIDYSAVSPKVALRFTPFGITAIDPDRTIFGQVPIGATFEGGSQFTESFVLPVLRDTKQRRMTFRLEKPISRADVAHLIATTPGPITFELPGVKFDLKNATLEWKDNAVLIHLK